MLFNPTPMQRYFFIPTYLTFNACFLLQSMGWNIVQKTYIFRKPLKTFISCGIYNTIKISFHILIVILSSDVSSLTNTIWHWKWRTACSYWVLKFVSRDSRLQVYTPLWSYTTEWSPRAARSSRSTIPWKLNLVRPVSEAWQLTPKVHSWLSLNGYWSVDRA